MRISIIIPSYNQAEFIGETLDSISVQGADDVEVLVIDGGSTDGTVELLKARSDQLAFWCSEPDRGQTHAINKGLERITGEVWAYVNSDDLLKPDCLRKVLEHLESHPDCPWLGGHAETFNHTGVIGEVAPGPVESAIDYLAPWSRRRRHVFPFSGCVFMRRNLSDRLGPMDESLHYSMDIEFYCRALFQEGAAPDLLPDTLAAWRWHPSAKTMERGIAYAFRQDEITIAERYLNRLPPEQQSRLKRELRRERLLLPPRKACYLLAQGKRSEAMATLMRHALARPDCLFSRPWLGAVRRVFKPQGGTASLPFTPHP